MSKIAKLLLSLEFKVLIFFMFYIIALFGSVIFSFNFFYAILICLAIIISWKIILGISWVNFSFLFFAFLEANTINSFLKPIWTIIFIFLFLLFFWKKCFAYQRAPMKSQNSESNGGKYLTSPASSKMEKYWREVLFYYLFLTWVIISCGLYFFLNYSFSISFLIYLLGLMAFSYLYLVFSNIHCFNFLLSFLVFLLVNLEFFVLLSYLSLNVLVLSILLVLLFRFSVYFLERKSLSIVPL